MMHKKNIIGLTGLIGSGKSEVAKIFAQLGAEIIDTDVIAHELTSANNDTLVEIAQQFGQEYITATGVLDRAKMRDLVFNNDSARLKLEEILHEKIYNRTCALLAKSRAKLVVLVVPLLFKVNKFRRLVTHTIFVDAPMHEIYQRLHKRNNFSVTEINNIIATQVARELQLRLANTVIVNDEHGLDKLSAQVKAVYRVLTDTSD